jgi:hypothetical protein
MVFPSEPVHLNLMNPAVVPVAAVGFSPIMKR